MPAPARDRDARARSPTRRGGRRRLPRQSRASWASCRTTPRCSRRSASVSCASARAAQEEFFAIAGGFVQVRPDKVVVMAETGRPGLGDRPREPPRQARDEAERALRGLRGAGRPGRARGPRWSGAAAHPRRRTSAPRGAAARGVASMADARPFHWEYQAPPVQREAFRVDGGHPLRGTVPISGSKNAALKLLAAATLTGERCRFTNVPEIADVARHGRDAARPGRRRRPPGAEHLRGRRRATSTGCSCRSRRRPRCAPASSCSGRSWRASAGSSSATPAATASGGGRSTSTSTRCARWAPTSSTATATTSRARRAGCAAPRRRSPHVTVMGTENAMLAATLADGHTTIRPAAQEPEVDDLIGFLQAWAPRSSAPRPTPSRSRAGAGCAVPTTASPPIASRRARSSSRRPSPAAR